MKNNECDHEVVADEERPRYRFIKFYQQQAAAKNHGRSMFRYRRHVLCIGGILFPTFRALITSLAIFFPAVVSRMSLVYRHSTPRVISTFIRGLR